MAGLLEIFVIRTLDPERAKVQIPEGHAVKLSQGFQVIPLTRAVKAALDPDSDPVLGFLELTPRMVTIGENISRVDPVAYCHLEYHGGTGFQAAIAWTDGAVSCGPVFTANHPAERVTARYVLVDRILDNAINVALRHMGAKVGDSMDEFQAIGLERHRWTEEWTG